LRNRRSASSKGYEPFKKSMSLKYEPASELLHIQVSDSCDAMSELDKLLGLSVSDDLGTLNPTPAQQQNGHDGTALTMLTRRSFPKPVGSKAVTWLQVSDSCDAMSELDNLLGLSVSSQVLEGP